MAAANFGCRDADYSATAMIGIASSRLNYPESSAACGRATDAWSPGQARGL